MSAPENRPKKYGTRLRVTEDRDIRVTVVDLEDRYIYRLEVLRTEDDSRAAWLESEETK